MSKKSSEESQRQMCLKAKTQTLFSACSNISGEQLSYAFLTERKITDKSFAFVIEHNGMCISHQIG